jgi:hypothetical protein
MEIVQNRFTITEKSTISRLLINGEFSGYILEDPVRVLVDKNNDGDFDDAGEGKIWGRTAIPAGVYHPKIRKSGKHYLKYRKRWDWHKGTITLDPVPGFKWIMIHLGNTPEDTHGCLLPGLTYGKDRVFSSTSAYYKIYHPIYAALEAKEEVTWTIIDPPAQVD